MSFFVAARAGGMVHFMAMWVGTPRDLPVLICCPLRTRNSRFDCARSCSEYGAERSLRRPHTLLDLLDARALSIGYSPGSTVVVYKGARTWSNTWYE